MSNFQRDCCELLAERFRSGKLDRRGFLTGLVALGAATMAAPGARAAGQKLVVVNWGGDAIDAYSAAFAEAYEAATGNKLKIDGSGPLEGSMKTQFESNSVRWDVCDAEPYSAIRLGREGMMEKIDYSIVDRSKIEPGFDGEFYVPSYFYSNVIAYDAARFGDDAPSTWADFWNVAKYPGKRTLYKWMTGVLEAALLADGVAPAELYPLDVDRALAKIEVLKPHIVSFWSSGAESQQLLRDGEASMGLLWHTRANLTKQDTEGEVDWTFDQGLVSPSGWTVIKGNPAGLKAAMEFIALAQNPDNQVTLLNELGNGPANPAAHALVSEEMKPVDASSKENLERQIALQAEWYADHYGTALDKYLALVSS
ncbi:ABC transporter substrate-binding protein [Phaeobacter inhibens]|uniref:ABC transporter substrate-binding protein n=1 Tax=Phaeobacter inhibens TaxID=221822 RepID=UPI0021A34570|nr:ABC transporter substrate-binding protein [Phaeobacter inhibens]UWR71022.1 ABC transporter substrate-binding protein [Phaeobacter inhibens]